MPIVAGSHLGPYEIISALGAGGMGEVYKARDRRLDRIVAIKVLPQHIAEVPDLRARFEREARAVGSLNHPHICVLYDIGNEERVGGYMVLEYIEGQTLAARLEKGPLPLEQAILFARQMADALDRAHRAGVTHRDIKPHNLMLTRDGVKVLDFGLAKSAAKPGPADQTLAAGLTTAGTVLGTPQYMAPEQFEGIEADARSDIWAFGAVLYEMVAGHPAFQGKSYASLVGAIHGAEPPPLQTTPLPPAWLDRLVRRCLAKDPEDRWQSMRDVVLELRTPWAETRTEVTRTSRRVPIAAAVVALAAGLAIGAGAVSRPWGGEVARPPQRLQLLPPDGGEFDAASGFALSPDGNSLVFVASTRERGGLWVRHLRETTARYLPGTDTAMSPFWSPDGRSIGFMAAGKIFRMEVDGSAPMALCDIPGVRGADWGTDGYIWFGMGSGGLNRVPAAGGAIEAVSVPVKGETGHWFPRVLPGGLLLFDVRGDEERTGTYIAKVDNVRAAVRLAPTGNAVYAAGRLLWLRGSALVAQPLDIKAMRLAGEPQTVADPVGTGQYGRVAVSAADSGLLVHARTTGSQLTWLTPDGKVNPGERRSLGQPGDYISLTLSPNGKKTLFSRGSNNGRDLWVVDVERDAWSRLTFLPGVAQRAVWAPDGETIVFNGGTNYSLYRRDSSGAGTEEMIWEADGQKFPTDWSSDGILYYEFSRETKRDLRILPVGPDGRPKDGAKPWSFLNTRFNERDGRFMPGLHPKWVAYTSDESGMHEIYIQSFPEPRGKSQISSGGGMFPDWRPDGKELYYVSPAGRLMAVRLTISGDTITPSAPRELTQLHSGSLAYKQYAVAPDGSGFLVPSLPGGSRPLEVVVNWMSLGVAE